jgi:hypothetical protein
MPYVTVYTRPRWSPPTDPAVSPTNEQKAVEVYLGTIPDSVCKALVRYIPGLRPDDVVVDHQQLSRFARNAPDVRTRVSPMSTEPLEDNYDEVLAALGNELTLDLNMALHVQGIHPPDTHDVELITLTGIGQTRRADGTKSPAWRSMR